MADGLLTVFLTTSLVLGTTGLTRCKDYLCMHGGTCFDLAIPHSGFYCLCPQNFVGTYCERPTACVQRPCHNGGHCVNQGSGIFFRCNCTSPYYGELCEWRRSTESPSTTTREGTDSYLGIVIIMLAILFLGLIACIFCYCRQQQPRHAHARNQRAARQPNGRSRYPLPSVSRNVSLDFHDGSTSGVSNVAFVNSCDLPPPYASVMGELKSAGHGVQTLPTPPSYEEAVSNPVTFGSDHQAACSGLGAGSQASSLGSSFSAMSPGPSADEQAPANHSESRGSSSAQSTDNSNAQCSAPE